MLLIDREMTVKESITDKSINLCYCQASFNSDGNITLRNYDIHDKNSDEIIILSAKESEAIFNLFSQISRRTNNGLPF